MSSMENGSKRSSRAEEYVRFVAVSATPSAMTTREVEEASAADEELSTVRQCISGKPWDQLVYKRYLPCSGELCTIGKLILRGTRIVIRKKLRPEWHPLPTKATWALLELSRSFRSKVWWPGMDRDAEKPAIGVSWSVVPLPQSLLEPHPYPLDRGETWLLIYSDHFLLANPSWSL